MAKPKISEMLLDVCADFIALAPDDRMRQQMLQGAASAWNIACMPPSKRDDALRRFMVEYRAGNPNRTEPDYENIKQDMLLLIEKKLKLYPDVHAPIVHVSTEMIGNKRRVNVVTVGGAATSPSSAAPNRPCPCGSGKKFKKCCGRLQ